MLGSLLMVEACSDKEGGGLESDTAEPPEGGRTVISPIQIKVNKLLCC